ncbi:glycoside hydrolase family 3 N-terminal domain-containing protein [Streptomyces sp. NPDC058623]|uniref:glycoside hydrolase family 3 N-terminal domain-containing protein n=1 Tax=Streptomyces sp. NPDC058623 TaxID=3346563 RepID=UPI0036491BEC
MLGSLAHHPDQELRRLAETVLQPGFDGTRPPDWLLRRLQAGLGGILLFARNTPSVTATRNVTDLIKAENPEAVIAVDEEGGAITRLEAARGSSWPGNAATGRIDDPEVTQQLAAELGAFIAQTGISLNYAPTADINSDPRNPVIGVRSFGMRAQLAARHAAAFVRGMQSAGVAACAKHFPGHGDTAVDSHLALPVVRASRRTMTERELAPFRAAIAADVQAVMAGHLLVPAWDSARPASLSPALLEGLLRGELGFQGVIATDALDMKALDSSASLPGLALRAISAGADLICIGARLVDEEALLAMRDRVVEAVTVGELPAERLVEAAGRVRRLAVWQRAAASRAAAAGAPDAPRTPAGAAAARALDLTINLVRHPFPLRKPPVVITLDVPPPTAAGPRTAWGIGALLAQRMQGTASVTLRQGEDADALCPYLDDHQRPLVIVVRDHPRDAWAGRILETIISRRPDAGVVDMGLPGTARPGAWHLATYSPSAVSARAAVDLITGRR